VKNGGRFALVHRPERLCDLFQALRENRLEPKRLQFLQSGKNPPSAVLVEAYKQARPGLRVLPVLQNL
jgi:tRNA1(Val) A37 N6-methylase TrmN6